MLECADNLAFMSKLLDNSIDLIYCDILYGTGRKFKNYQDLSPNKQQIVLHYQPRLLEMHRLLKDTGTICLQMDYRINHWIRCLLDDIFGYHNFRNEIIWHYNSAPRKKNCFGNRHDTILRYTKSDSFTFNEIREPYSLSAPRGYEKEKYYHPEGKVLGDVWQINILGQNDKTERNGYSTQKPKKLLEKIIISMSNENDVVADFYCGSGTTLVVAKDHNRKYIGCDISEEAIQITTKRINEKGATDVIN
jgi:site-specific DNA-methyltransferase (adenine-specific)